MASDTLALPRQALVLSTHAKKLLLLVIALGACLSIWVAVNNSAVWGMDFNQFYSASRLAGTGQIYNWEVLRKIEDENGKEVPTGRLPVVILGAKLIGWMPFKVAHIVWLAASMAALAIFAVAWPGADRWLMFLSIAWSMPVGMLLVLGQDTPFWLMFCALGLLLLERQRPRLAGVVFALCICKFHLAVGIPVLLAAQKRWSAFFSACATGAALLVSCFLIEGPKWPLEYLAASRRPTFSPAVARMPNLNGLAYWFPWPLAVEAVLALALICLLWLVCRRTPNLGAAGAAAAAAGVLLAHHCYSNDCALLIPSMVFTIQRPAIPRWLKAGAALLFTPASTLLLATPKPYFAQLLVVAFVAAALLMEAKALPAGRRIAAAR